MADSFGVEYATRSNEEGFGGVYGGNQSLHDEEEEDDIEINRHGNPPGKFTLISVTFRE